MCMDLLYVQVDAKTPMCSIVVYGQTLIKRTGKNTRDDTLLMNNVRCIPPSDFVNKENGEMVEVFVSAPWP